MKKAIIWLIVIILVAVGLYFIFQGTTTSVDVDEDGDNGTTTDTVTTDDDDDSTETEEDSGQKVIGKSAEGRDIMEYHFGTGDTHLLFVGGIHGGYSWNTALVANELIDYLDENPEVIPENIKVSVIPVLNPDGLRRVVGTATADFSESDVSSSEETKISGRFNANNVDLNRNFDCDWQASGTWQSRTVSGGDEAFSEPEAQAIRDYIEESEPDAVVVWYSAAGGIFSSSCHDGVLPETLAITNVYADASGYPSFEEFDFYEITGDMVNWLAKEGIPAISVLLTTHDDVEWQKNRAGIEALLEHYEN